MKRLRAAIAFATVAVMALLTAAPALATAPGTSGYLPEGPEIQSQVTQQGSLAFTGLDMGMIVAAALLLLALGLVLRRVQRTDDTA